LGTPGPLKRLCHQNWQFLTKNATAGTAAAASELLNPAQ